MRVTIFVIVTAAAAMFSLPRLSRGCGFDGVLGDGFGVSHPQSLTVAFAVRDAIDNGALDPAVLLPALEGQAGYARATMRLNAFHRRLSAGLKSSADAAPSVSILLVDSKLWARLTPNEKGLELTLHTAGPQTGDVIAVTHEAILAAITSKTISPAAALDLKLLIIDGDETKSAAFRNLLLPKQ